MSVPARPVQTLIVTLFFSTFNLIIQSVAKDAVTKSVILCNKVSRLSQQHRSVLSKLFPTSTASSSKIQPVKSFDPGAPLVTLKEKLKKKSPAVPGLNRTNVGRL